MIEKERLDVLLVNRGLETTRERAKAVIMSGIVYVNNQKIDKAGFFCVETDEVEVRGATLQYVSRGGLKIEKAFDFFNVNPDGKCAIDVGASTGGFSDCMLTRGAKKVFAVDVGYGQLAWSVRSNPKVVVMERTNIRNVTPEMIGEALDLAVIDVSFISLKLVLPVVKDLLGEDGEILTLIKPQFEAGRAKVGKKGVVREKSTHIEVVQTILDFASEIGLFCDGLTFSPIKGPEGNIEFLAHLYLKDHGSLTVNIEAIVDEAHSEMKG